VAVNDRGRRIGETHHNSHISDAVVDQMRDRHEDGGLGYRKIAREFNVALTTVRKICTYERRAQTPERWKTLRIPVNGAPKPKLMERG
jgi:DNA invertase Pin-like site-specific DNA recombinase